MPNPVTASPAAPAPRRFMSVDALRGFDMLWIVGAGGLVSALHALSGNKETGILHLLSQQLSHKEWDGFAFYDLIFPLFVFLVGVSIVFSLGRVRTGQDRVSAFKRILKRFLLLYAVALLYSGGFSEPWPNIRLMGVLNRIALCYLFASIAFCLLKPRALAALCASLLIGYWALMTFVPFRDLRPVNEQGEAVGTKITAKRIDELNWASNRTIHGTFEPGLNFAHYVDQCLLPGKKWDGTWDPEGLLSTLPAIGTCLLGVFAGLLITSSTLGDQRKVFLLLGAGAASVLLGFLWGLQFPVIKKLWTSSFVLVAGGYSAMLLGAFYQVIEIWAWKSWAQPFVWVGANSITIYLANNIIGFRTLAKRFAGGDVSAFMDRTFAPGSGDLLLALVAIGIGLALVGFLYRKRLFLRL